MRILPPSPLFPALVVTTGACGALALLLLVPRARRLRLSPRVEVLLEVLLPLWVGLSGLLQVLRLAEARMGDGVWGQDVYEYVKYALHVLEPDIARDFSWLRYPFFPWVAAQVSLWMQVTPADGVRMVSVAASALLPLALYGLGRALAPAPVAAVGALATLHLLPVAESLGEANEYSFCVLFQVLCLAAALPVLKHGGRLPHLLLGLAASLFMASTNKALVILLPMALAVAARLLYDLVRARRGALVSVGLLVLPLAVTWRLYTPHSKDLLTLEHALYVVEVNDASKEGRMDRRVERLPWNPGAPPGVNGWWRVGDDRSLAHLPDTIRFFARSPQSFHWKGVLEHLSAALGLGARVAWLVPVILAGALAWTRGLVPSLLTSGFLSGVVLLQVASLNRAQWQDRYALPFLVTLPVLLAVGAASPFRRLAPSTGLLPWIPLLAAWGILSGPMAGPLAVPALEQHLLEVRLSGSPSWRLQMPRSRNLALRLAPGDHVVDVSEDCANVGWLMVPGGGVTFECIEKRNARPMAAAPQPGHRRFLVGGCYDDRLTPKDPVRWKALLDRNGADRFVPVTRCSVRDERPQDPLVVAGGGA